MHCVNCQPNYRKFLNNMLAAELNLETICRASGHLQIKLAANWRHESETGGA